MTVRLTPHRGVLRALRGAALGTVTALLAVAAHAAGGGGAPDGALTVLIAIAVAAAGTALADRQRGPLALLGAVALTQVILHLLLAALSVHHSAPSPVSAGLGMTGAHAVAVVITAALLAGAESALFGMARALRRIARMFPLAATPQPVHRPAPHALVEAAVAPELRRLLARVTPHRGPPRTC